MRPVSKPSPVHRRALGLRRRDPLQPVRGVQPLRARARPARSTSSARQRHQPARQRLGAPRAQRAHRAEFDDVFAAESEALGHRVPGADVLGAAVAATSGRRWSTLLDRVKAAGLPHRVPHQQRGQRRHAPERARRARSARSWRGSTSSSRPARSACASPSRASTRSRASCSACNPHECVFLDDLGINLKPAAAMGMTTIKVLSTAEPSPTHRLDLD